jgi:hypothetical protein
MPSLDGGEVAGVSESLAWHNYAWAILPLATPADAQPVPRKGCGAPVSRLFFLGARYSYWGNLMKPLAGVLYEKTHSVIYAAKCGVLTSQDDIHRVVMPVKHIIVEEGSDASEGRARALPLHRTLHYIRGEAREDLFASQRQVIAGVGAAAGWHATVPSLVGETYAQQALLEETAASQARHDRLARRLKHSLQGGEKEWEVEAWLQGKLSGMDSPAAREAVYVRAVYRFLGPGAADRFLDGFEDYSARVLDSAEAPLLSIDNETGWLAEAAHRANGFFTAVHRTTDYVRKRRDAGVITADDLDKEQGHSGARRQLLGHINAIIYKLIRLNLRFRRISTSALVAPDQPPVPSDP